MGYSPWGCKESDTTEWLTHIRTWCIRHFLKTIVHVSLHFRLTSRYHYYLYFINWGIDGSRNFSNIIPSFLDGSIILSVVTHDCVFSIMWLSCSILYLIEEIIVDRYCSLVKLQNTCLSRSLKIEHSYENFHNWNSVKQRRN